MHPKSKWGAVACVDEAYGAGARHGAQSTMPDGFFEAVYRLKRAPTFERWGVDRLMRRVMAPLAVSL